jgi:hypothetical protein
LASHALDIVLVYVLECALLMSGCVGLQTHADSGNSAEINLQGVWNGMSVNDCSPVQVDPGRCRAVEQISFTMLHRNERSWGFYRCAPGTTPCYHQVDRGDIKYLQLTGRVLWFRVMRDDHSSCLFDTILATDRMRGKFWCFDGSALIERGFFQVDRVY